MDFAKKILCKYGWKEGDGLGKNNNGIAVPLKARLKFDNTGLGVDRAQEFNDHWWERCFNEAANNVEVQVQQNGKISTARKDGEEAVEISTKGFSAKKLRKAKEQHASDGKATYENFIQTSLLTQGGSEVENTERIKVDDIAVSKVSVLTDEELFKACGGRTAHKGARHGLKLSGKIARLEQQEREMLEKLQNKLKSSSEEESLWKQKKEKDISAKYLPAKENEVSNDEVEEPIKPKKKKKASKEDSSETVEEEVPLKSKKKKKDKTAEKPKDEVTKEQHQDEVEEPKKLKKKKNNKTEKPQEVSEEAEEQCEIVVAEEAKPKNKRKSMDIAEETEGPVKPKKKKKKNKDE
ncbi:hypothetical protein KR009_004158 [Drosophila setifemur]|nr:hypothetical protein KR009_004158 [Drosophila setifemur]